jgi:hypothetical protein
MVVNDGKVQLMWVDVLMFVQRNTPLTCTLLHNSTPSPPHHHHHQV